RNAGRGAVDDAVQVDADEAVPDFGAGLPERLARVGIGRGARIAGIVDQNVDRAEGLLGFADHRPHRGEIGDVGLQRDRLAAGGVDFARDLLCAFKEVIIDDNARRVVRGEMQRDLAPDALARTGDQRHLAVQIKDITHTFLSRPFQ
ncbi:hypothetical protein chiPu_0034031, partial [Chiloscyllium punctatum]|nr:hypothetical protein [Chiloscyllium punctatum]